MYQQNVLAKLFPHSLIRALASYFGARIYVLCSNSYFSSSCTILALYHVTSEKPDFSRKSRTMLWVYWIDAEYTFQVLTGCLHVHFVNALNGKYGDCSLVNRKYRVLCQHDNMHHVNILPAVRRSSFWSFIQVSC